MKKTFRIVPLPTALAEQARRTAALGQPDHQVVIADGPKSAPCRHCLRWADSGETMILFPYQSIPTDRPYAESGPIFVHQEACQRYAATETYPAAFSTARVIRGYNTQCEIIAGEAATGDAEPVLEAMLQDPDISFLHVRSLTYGCYTMKVERA
ncbi:MAG: DUF1203 domain-containing protein [Chthoniobacterales bacterium]